MSETITQQRLEHLPDGPSKSQDVGVSTSVSTMREDIPSVEDAFIVTIDKKTFLLTEDAAHELWYQLHLRFKDRKYVYVLPEGDDPA
jgi:hypothetical protein